MIQRVVSLVLAVAFLLAAFLITAALCFAAWAWWRGRRGPRVIEGEYRIIESK